MIVKRSHKITAKVLGTLILIPIVLFAGYAGYSVAVDKYTIHRLHQVAPDAYKYDYQCYETLNGAYQADFYKFTEYHPEKIEDWEAEENCGYVFRTCTIDAGFLHPIIIINKSALCATIEYHCTFWE